MCIAERLVSSTAPAFIDIICTQGSVQGHFKGLLYLANNKIEVVIGSADGPRPDVPTASSQASFSTPVTLFTLAKGNVDVATPWPWPHSSHAVMSPSPAPPAPQPHLGAVGTSAAGAVADVPPQPQQPPQPLVSEAGDVSRQQPLHTQHAAAPQTAPETGATHSWYGAAGGPEAGRMRVPGDDVRLDAGTSGTGPVASYPPPQPPLSAAAASMNSGQMASPALHGPPLDAADEQLHRGMTGSASSAPQVNGAQGQQGQNGAEAEDVEQDESLRQVLETCHCCLSHSNSRAQACCKAVDDDVQQASNLCLEIARQHVPPPASPMAGAGGVSLGRMTTDSGGRKGRGSRVGKPAREVSALGQDSALPADVGEGGMGLSKMYDLIGASTTAWLGAALVVVAALLLAKRCCASLRSRNSGGRKYGHYRMVGLAGSAPPSDEISPYD